MLIERPPKVYRRCFPGVTFRMPPSTDGKPKVYITFDDGPIPEATPMVLDILDRYDVKATFFMVGQNVERYPWLLEEVIKRGHQVANHTHRHIRGRGISPADYLKDVDECRKLTHSDLFRPPHGWMTSDQLREVKKHYRVVMFDLVTRDYSKLIDTDRIVRNVKKYARDGAIIVFHDSLKSCEKLERALPASLRWLKDNGYQFELL